MGSSREPRRALPSTEEIGEPHGYDADHPREDGLLAEFGEPVPDPEDAARRGRVDEGHDTVEPGNDDVPRRGVQGSSGGPAGIITQLLERRPLFIALSVVVALAVLAAAVLLIRGLQNTEEPGATQNSTTESVTAEAPSPPAETDDTAVPSPLEQPENARLALDDTSVTIPEGWELYADESVDESRRLVRLRDPDSDIRVQVVTLTAVGEDLSAACQALVDDQSTAYTNVTPVLPSPIGLNSTEGTGVVCGFGGTRISDTDDNSVTFTLLQRTSDAHSLILRSTIPASVPTDSPGRAALFGLTCEASSGFGPPLPLC